VRPWVVRSEVAAADERVEEDEKPGDGQPGDGQPGVATVGPATLADLYRERYVPMVRLAFLMVGSTSVAEDLVQDAFARMHRHWDNAEHPRAYLRMAVVNACRSHLRRLSLERAYRQRPSALAEAVQAGSPWAEPDELFDALGALPARQRAALVLRFYEDLSEADIAVALGCRPGTVKSLLHRGLAELRKVVEQ
jgi:RNA polymerase sigma-70 factor (sigma-E family)